MVSNRLPVNITRRGGELRFQQSVGGVAVGLASIREQYAEVWVGWPGLAVDRAKERVDDIEDKLRDLGLKPVFLSQQEVEQFYYGFCNRTIWPLFHYFTHYTVYSRRLWDAYVNVNQKMADAVAEVAEPGDTIWVHDYQYMLLPKLLREKGMGLKIGFFLHIPFPSYEIFRLLPWREEIIEGIMGADLIGFHTYDYVRHFLSCTRRLLGYEGNLLQVSKGNRYVRVDAFPMGIDYDRFAGMAETPDVQKEIQHIRDKVGDRKVVLSVDRLDYTKGIPERLEAFGRFLASNPEYEDKVTMIMVAVPSRTRVEHYVQLKSRVDQLVGRINGRYGTLDWMPVWYLYRSVPFRTLSALYKTSDIALLTPLRDGMNLIAKEFIASKTDDKGVLVLSELAGASNVLGEAITINPNNRDQVVEALKIAMSMPEHEQVERNRIMKARLRRYNLKGWAGHFLDSLSAIISHQRDLVARTVTSGVKSAILGDYSKAGRRLILLDYDGTLVPYRDKPSQGRPDRAVKETLAALSSDERNEVVVASGRDKGTLQEWLGDLNVGLIAEHGVWLREKQGDWNMIESLENDWKEEVRPYLELYVDRTPGSFQEEKDYSLVWHYGRVEPGLGSLRARELRDELVDLTANLNLAVLEGEKAIEIKNASANKGRAAAQWISKGPWDFILAAGDDFTDEEVFSVLPEDAYSIRVNLTSSRAKYNVESYADIRTLVGDLTEIGGESSILAGRKDAPAVTNDPGDAG